MKRRNLLKAGGVGALTLGASSVVKAAEPEFNWKMAMSWPKKFPGLATTAQWFADEVKRVTNGRMTITLYGAGELVPAFEVFNAVSDGTVEVGHGTPYYWKGIVPEAEIFTSVPFGLNAVEFNAWHEIGDGGKLHNQLYKPFGVVSLLGGNTDYQMGGWFNKEIKSLEDLKSLKIRMPGIAGEVLKRAGATTVSIPGSEIFTSMQSGVIDASDWVAPWNDQAFGLYKVAKYYYGGWQEPSASVEILFNEKAWQSLPEDLRAQVQAVAQASNQRMLNEYRFNNGKSLENLLNKHNVKVVYFPDDVMKKLKELTDQYLDEYAGRSALAKQIADSYRGFLAEQVRNSENEQHILRYRTL